MTTPTIFSNVASATNAVDNQRQGLTAVRFSLTIPSGTTAATTAGIIRVTKGFALLGLRLKVPVLDTTNALTFDIGYSYDNTTDFTEDLNAYVAASVVARTASNANLAYGDGITDLLFGEPPVLATKGYISFTTAAASTDTAGTIEGVALGTYNLSGAQ